jgi:hypothetical protein
MFWLCGKDTYALGLADRNCANEKTAAAARHNDCIKRVAHVGDLVQEFSDGCCLAKDDVAVVGCWDEDGAGGALDLGG